jgi:hypothetical protein
LNTHKQQLRGLPWALAERLSAQRRHPSLPQHTGSLGLAVGLQFEAAGFLRIL